VDYLMDWIEIQLDDEAIFPQQLGNFSLNLSVVAKCNTLETVLLGFEILFLPDQLPFVLLTLNRSSFPSQLP
jgi:hypothetical protein